MATYVLVPGMWVGGWAFRDVTAELRAAGHEVSPVTLTGLGERSHLAGPHVDLTTHVTDVVNLIRHEELADVVLVGHSYAGTVVTAVADEVADRVGTEVYLDAAPAADGECHLGFHPPEVLEAVAGQVAALGEGWRMPAPDFAEVAADSSGAGLTEQMCARMNRLAVPHGHPTLVQPVRLRGGGGATDHRRVVIACNDFRDHLAAGVPRFQAATTAGWERHDIATGHWAMFSAPGEVAALLHEIGGPAHR